jgi:hypothetical protein
MTTEKTTEIIKYDVPFEVSKEQYSFLMNNFQGIVAGREQEEKYYIKVWLIQYAKQIENFLKIKK